MIFFIAAGEFPCLGILARFANNSVVGPIMLFKGMSLADLVDPIFLFIISISYKPSFDRRFDKIGNKAYLHFLTRYLCFMGAGSILVSIEYLVIKHVPDPYYIQTILMFVVFGGLAVLGILKLIRSIPKKVSEIVGKVISYSLIALALIGIILGIRDDILVFTNNNTLELYKHWSILHEIGMTGLLVIPFIKLSQKWKTVSWCILTACYTALQMLPTVIEKFDVVVLGGLVGTLGWLILMLGSIIMMSFYRAESKKGFYISLGVLIVLTALACIFLPMNTSAVTINYVLFALCAAIALFALVNLSNHWKPKFAFFVWWGENPLLLFLVGLIFKGLLLLWNPSPDTPLWIAAPAVFGPTALLTFFAYKLHKKQIHFKF